MKSESYRFLGHFNKIHVLQPTDGYNISYEGEKDLNIKAANCVKVLGIINQIFKPSLVSRHTRIRVYKPLARPVLSYGSEAWTVRRADERRLISAEMCFLRRTAGYTRWDHKRNEDILTELQMSQITEYIYTVELGYNVMKGTEKFVSL
jgi:hypothetical protein